MEQPPEAALVWTPAEVRMRVHRAGEGLEEPVVASERQESVQHAFESNLIRRYAPVAVKDSRIGIAEDGVTDVRKALPQIRAIGVDDLFDTEFRWSDHGATPLPAVSPQRYALYWAARAAGLCHLVSELPPCQRG